MTGSDMGSSDTGPSSDLADRLLDAQVAFAKEQLLRPELLEAAITEEVDGFLDLTSELTLGEAVDAQLIKDVARKYAVQIPVEGAIPELVGEIASRIYAHSANDELNFSDVVTDRAVDELLTGAAELDLTPRLLSAVLDSPLIVDICVEVVQHAVATSVARPALPLVSRALERITRTGATFVLRGNRDGAGDALLDAARDVWRAHQGDAIGSYRDVVTAADLEDIVVLAFEFWRTFRDTEYFHSMLDEGIDHVFAKYGEVPLADLLAELGIGRTDLLEEGMRFAPSVITTVDRHGYLDTVLRRQLEPFYRSAAFIAALEPER